MHNDLKILFWLTLVALTILIVYAVVDYTFEALDNPKNYQFYRTFRSTFTSDPNQEDPDVKPDPEWKPKREPMPFLGYAHTSAVLMISGIILIALMGFFIIYLLNRKGQ